MKFKHTDTNAYNQIEYVHINWKNRSELMYTQRYLSFFMQN